MAVNSTLETLRNVERDAAKTQTVRIVNMMIAVRKLFENFDQVVGYVVGICLLCVGLGLLLGLMCLWRHPSAGGKAEVCLSRPMLFVLACQMGALWVAALLALLLLMLILAVAPG